jgi:hypothetical protein
MFNHYRPVWEKLGRNNVELVLYGDPSSRKTSRKMAILENYKVVDYEVIRDSEKKYPVFVSNHSMYEYKGKSINLFLGEKQVRFMYALGKAKHNFSSWNNDYDLILCFGPYQAERLKQSCSAVIFQMGYPRYDKYFTAKINKEKIMQELALDTSKKTIVWLPTWKELSTVDDFADVISSLSTQYNVVVKTHPLSAIEEAGRLEKLKQFAFTKVITEIYDNLELYAIADWIMADYGGPAFGALYLDIPLLLLNLPNAENDQLTGADSPDILLREYIVNVDKQQRWEIAGLILRDEIWQEQTTSRRLLRQQHFYPSYGCSADLAATALQNIHNILAMA